MNKTKKTKTGARDVFNRFTDGKYLEAYVKPCWPFYSKIQEQMAENILPGNRVLDIGSGPGCGALLAHQSKLECLIVGVEPSDLHKTGTEYAGFLEQAHSTTRFQAMRGGMQNIPDILLDAGEPSQFDAIMIMRALHEIIHSVGGKQTLVAELGRVLNLLPLGGKAIIGEPYYSQETLNHPERKRIIELTGRYLIEKIGHCDPPKALISPATLGRWMNGMGFSVNYFTTIQNQGTMSNIRESGYDLRGSPTIFYVATFEKQRSVR